MDALAMRRIAIPRTTSTSWRRDFCITRPASHAIYQCPIYELQHFCIDLTGMSLMLLSNALAFELIHKITHGSLGPPSNFERCDNKP
eukprot:4433070-Pyramimonas_sp.AAC.2